MFRSSSGPSDPLTTTSGAPNISVQTQQRDGPPASRHPSTTNLHAAPVHDNPYTTFTKRQKALLVLMASLAASFSGFASNIFFPAIPTMAEALGTTVENINLSVTTYMIFQAISPTFWG